MKKFMTVVLMGLVSTVAFAADENSSTSGVNNHEAIKYECKFRKRDNDKGEKQRCHVRGRICLNVTANATPMSGGSCNDGGITQKVECSDGFELRDPKLDVYLGLIAPPQRLLITYAKEDENEAYIHINPFRVSDRGVRAKLTTIVDDSEVDHYVGTCDIDDDRNPMLF